VAFMGVGASWGLAICDATADLANWENLPQKDRPA